MNKELPKIYEPKKVEKEIYTAWEKDGFFQPDKNTANGKYSIVMPPPNVTGTLHMGHAAMLAIEDILIRYNRMQGKSTLWIPGTDHAAIATQTKVEKIIKEEGLTRHQLGREKFLERVRQFAQQSHDTISEQVRAMGSSCDWSREAYTLDETRTKVVRTVFKMMHDDGLIYRGDRVVNWCPRCKSTLADDEVEHKTQKAPLYTFKYDKNFPITIATTRPETKLGDTAVAVNPSDERYKKYVGQTLSADFCGKKLNLKIIADRNIEMDFGTGALGVTPAHSMIDWKMAKEHDLEIVKVIDEDGNIKEGFAEFSGKSAKEARKMIVEKLSQQNLIEKEEEIENNLSVCYRCGTSIEPLPSLQWFVDVNKKISRHGKSLKELSLAAVSSGVFDREKIQIIPERFEKDYFRWMENLQDWCISRQIWFGHQIPVWYKDGETFVGIEEPAGDEWIQDTDTLDTWFSSGMWTFSTLANNPEQIKLENGKLIIDSEDFRNFHPTDVLETGYDILFFWIARMILMTTYAIGDIPFKNVYLHGLVRDDKGKKMSKSLGNVIDPLDMIAKYGTDATRLSLVIGSTPGNDLKLSEEKIESFRNFTNKIWNIGRYIISNQTKEKTGQIECKNFTLADNWILSKLQEVVMQVTDDIEKFRFSQASEKLHDFTWSEFADWYLEIAKFEDNKTEKQWVLENVLDTILRLWHPFMPFVTETIWKELDRKKSLINEKWPTTDAQTENTVAHEKLFDFIREIIIAIRNARIENKIDLKKEISILISTENQKDYQGTNTQKLIQEQEIIIKKLRTGVSSIGFTDTKIENSITRTIAGLTIYIPLEGLVDVKKEKEKITKEIESIEKFVGGLRGRLENADFVAKAPAQVINQQKETLAKKQTELAELKKHLSSL
ncbi:MAG: valine--tRNA ligase [Candidatus Moranbacteria bacterium]|nr:valine--tRNA ligase [Candidatus Moranbacteria bacterium]